MVELLSFDELLSDDPAWPLVQQWVAAAAHTVEVLPPNLAERAKALVACQVTTRSPLGAVIYESGGILVDQGWLRVLGSGCARLPRGIHSWNNDRRFVETGRRPTFFLVADDAVGGFFALNGGAFGDDQGNIYYHGPDSLEWEPLEMGYSAFLQWAFTPNLGEWSAQLRWAGWQAEVEALSGDRAIFVVPPLFTEGVPLADRYRGEVPVAELYSMYVDENAPTTPKAPEGAT